MEIKVLNVIKIIFGITGIFLAQAVFGQEIINPKVVNEEVFLKAIKANVFQVFAANPNGNIDSVKYEGHYAILKVNNGKISQIVYPDKTQPLITRMSEFAIKDINERIDKGEFEIQNIDQIIIPAIIEWIHFETNESQLYNALTNILPKIGYTSNTYMVATFVLARGNPIIN